MCEYSLASDWSEQSLSAQMFIIHSSQKDLLEAYGTRHSVQAYYHLFVAFKDSDSLLMNTHV